jgi:Phytanoyl-CoA dioxygenase (PhyH)
VEDNGVVEDVLSVGKHRAHFASTYAQFSNDQTLRDLVGDIIGHTPETTSLIISVMRESPVPTTPARLIGSNYLHADVHFPSVKAWLYLNDIDERNGAFVFAPGSHKLTAGRLAYEYESSIRVAKAKQQGAVHTAVPYGLVRMPRPDQMQAMGIREKSFVGKANTLVIANVMGFHRRGSFEPHVTRNLLMLRFGDRKVAKARES